MLVVLDVDSTLIEQEAIELLADDGETPEPIPVLAADDRAAWPGLLRRYRHACSTRLVWRDVHGLDTAPGALPTA